MAVHSGAGVACDTRPEVLLSGPLGEHGIAVMAAREGIELETTLASDSAGVVPLVRALLDAVPASHVLRDPTRGGLASALAEIAVASSVGISIEEAALPVPPAGNGLAVGRNGGQSAQMLHRRSGEERP
jgi:hydrogenase expression/formation protein HypE